MNTSVAFAFEEEDWSAKAAGWLTSCKFTIQVACEFTTCGYHYFTDRKTNDCLDGLPVGQFQQYLMWLLRALRRQQCGGSVMCSIPPLRDHSVSADNEVIRSMSIAQQRNAVFA